MVECLILLRVVLKPHMRATLTYLPYLYEAWIKLPTLVLECSLTLCIVPPYSQYFQTVTMWQLCYALKDNCKWSGSLHLFHVFFLNIFLAIEQKTKQKKPNRAKNTQTQHQSTFICKDSIAGITISFLKAYECYRKTIRVMCDSLLAQFNFACHCIFHLLWGRLMSLT